MSDPKQPDPEVPAPPVPPPGRGWDAMTWATVINSAGTLLALVVALFVGLRSLRVAEESLRATSESLRQNNLATVYTLGLEVTKFQEANPGLSKFFDKTHRPPTTDDELRAEFDRLPQDQKTLVLLGCERVADFTQLAFVQREVLPADEWDTWWNYMADQYDESPVYRDYLAKRAGWFTFLPAIRPENRAGYYRGSRRK